MVYLIHFDQPLAHAQHYLGYSADDKYEARLEHHRKGTGSRLMAALKRLGITWSVVRTWPNEDGNFERRMKNRKKSRCLCPTCRALRKQQKEK